MRAVAVYILDEDVGGVRLEADAVYVTVSAMAIAKVAGSKKYNTPSILLS